MEINVSDFSIIEERRDGFIFPHTIFLSRKVGFVFLTALF